MSSRDVTIYDSTNEEVKRPICKTDISNEAIEKGGYKHFMAKEIYEQPQVIGDTLQSFINPSIGTVTLPNFSFDLAKATKFTLIACGSSFYACLLAKYWLETNALVSVEVDIASEFRYRKAEMPDGGVCIFVSQSGETADTLAALRYSREQDQNILSIVNVPGSTIARESDVVLHTNAGPEIGVASTKALTTQMTVLACLTIAVARKRGTMDAETEARLVVALTEVPARAADVLNHAERLAQIAIEIAGARDVLYLGRGTSYPIALEGALKLKEISYIHAEGYAAGEMKHGPIALIDDGVPVIVIAPMDDLFEKTASNMAEVMARKGRVIFFSNAEGVERFKDQTADAIALPDVDPFVAPILYTIPVQLLAYHTAVIKDTDIDQPRNLAKSVTVE
jgi:glucosamine--fructose-6-phosphate aminotransferase (isomerizing)